MMRTRPSLPDIPRNNILLDFVTKQMLPGQLPGEEDLGGGATSDFDFSPLTPSDQRVAVGQQQQQEVTAATSEVVEESEEEEEYGGGEADACSLDEGLGDLSDGDLPENHQEVAADVVEEGADPGKDGSSEGNVFEVVASEKETVERIFIVEDEITKMEDSLEEAPPLPEAEPPGTNGKEKERKPSRIPKMIHSGGLQRNSDINQEPEKGSKEADGATEKSQDGRERTFSPERRPSRISFETML